MSTAKLPSYVLQELPDITESINYPIKNIQRVKYTCFDVSRSLIAFGATSGGIYVFNRSPCEFLQLIPNKDGIITRLSISADEAHISIANGRGLVTVTKCSQSLSGGHCTVTSKEHQGNEVTSMVWSGTNLFIGDDVGKVSVLQLTGFIAKTMFQTPSQTIMSLDSRICQLDVKGCMLLVSTLTRCYICDTSQEQYRQIGQKARDGEFGACFIQHDKCLQNGTDVTQDFTEVKTYNMVDEDATFAVGKDLENTLVYCARPSSRLWEASVHGMVKRTHQFKHVLAKNATSVITNDMYEDDRVDIQSLDVDGEGRSVNFTKIFNLNGVIFSFKKDALYFLNIHNEGDTLWCDFYKDIVDCKIVHDNLYMWLSSGKVVHLRFMKVDKFLIKCYVEEKYAVCADVCALYRDYLLNNNVSSKLHILLGLREKLPSELILSIESVLDKLESIKNEATQLKSGIFVVDNTYNAQTSLDFEDEQKNNTKFGVKPEALQTLKDLSISVTDKINSSKKIFKEKWDDFEGKMKTLNEKPNIEAQFSLPDIVQYEIKDIVPLEYDNDVIYNKEPSQKAIEPINLDSNTEDDKMCKLLYQHSRMSRMDSEEQTNLVSIIETYSCDIEQIYLLMLHLEKYCETVNATEDSKYMPSNIFLAYLNLSPQKHNLLDCVINNEEIYKYFVESCIIVNVKLQRLTNIGCECGFPLPYTKTSKKPAYSELIDEFIEKQWSNQTSNQCYDMCKRMPYLWRKILYLRRNDDLLNILQIILQMLDEALLHSFLPQFTLETWDRAVQLYAVLNRNICLNCSKHFDHMSVKETLRWDDIGRLIIKSVGGKNAIKVFEKHASLIEAGDLTMKFYHTCLLVTMYERYDATITAQLTDALYSAYEFEDARVEICSLLRSTTDGRAKNTALPIVVAANTNQWGLEPLREKVRLDSSSENAQNGLENSQKDSENSQNDIENPQKGSDNPQDSGNSQKEGNIKNLTLCEIVKNLSVIKCAIDCTLCGLPLQNEVLIKDGGLWVFKCGHTFHGACLGLNRVKLCPSCTLKV